MFDVMSRTSIPLNGQTNETKLNSHEDSLVDALAAARDSKDPMSAMQQVAAKDPACLIAWANLANLADQPVEAYAYARTGYHRGLDALRAAGWRGSGLVRWSHEGNRGFLACLAALARLSEQLGDAAEAKRCKEFLASCDPTLGPDIVP